MKLRIRYEDKVTTLEVPDEECTVMIETDYQKRRNKADDPSTIVPRTAQEILDEELNRPDYNNWHRHNRHSSPTVHAPRLDGKRGVYLAADDTYTPPTNTIEEFPDTAAQLMKELTENYDDVCAVIRSALKPKQAELLIAVHLDRVRVTDIALQEGVTVGAITHRLETAEKNFKKLFPESSTYISSRG